MVEDDDDARRLIETYLTEGGFSVRSSGNGREALEALAGFTPDLVLLDLMMPVMDGMTFLAELRRDRRWIDLPVVVVTAKELTAEERKVLAANTETVLEKGQALDELLKEAVRRVLA